MKTFFLLFFLFLSNIILAQTPTKQDSLWLFVSFKDPGDGGIWFSLSKDGLKWTPANNDQPLLIPDLSKGKMRDPFICRGIKNDFHLLWTSGTGRIGHAVSSDLVNWSEHQLIPILPDDKRILNTWAPEMIFDQEKSEWVIFWSSTIKGDFPKTDGQVENEKNHRIYSMTTKDWKTFSNPKLFFDPGYPVIDATIFQDKENYLMVFKDERRWPMQKQLRTAQSKSIYGPWLEISEPITENWTEGPSLITLDGSFVIFFDAYKEDKRMGAIRSQDFRNWEKVSEDLEFPERYKHGSFLKISQKEAAKLFN